jgi:hypothetical protein
VERAPGVGLFECVVEKKKPCDGWGLLDPLHLEEQNAILLGFLQTKIPVRTFIRHRFNLKGIPVE